MAENVSKLKIPNDRSRELREQLQKTTQHRHLNLTAENQKPIENL